MKYRALMYKNDGQGVRLLMQYSEIVDSAEVAMKLAADLKRDNPAPEYWAAAVSKETSPHSFP